MSGTRYYTNYRIFADSKDLGNILGELAIAGTLSDAKIQVEEIRKSKGRFSVSISNNGYTDIVELAEKYTSMVATAINCYYDGCGGYEDISEAFADRKRVYKHHIFETGDGRDGTSRNTIEGSIEGYPELEGFDCKKEKSIDDFGGCPF